MNAEQAAECVACWCACGCDDNNHNFAHSRNCRMHFGVLARAWGIISYFLSSTKKIFKKEHTLLILLSTLFFYKNYVTNIDFRTRSWFNLVRFSCIWSDVTKYMINLTKLSQVSKGSIENVEAITPRMTEKNSFARIKKINTS